MKKNNVKPPKNYVDRLIEDHEMVKALFKKFAGTDSKKEKLTIVETTIAELKLHAQLEEEIVYPALRAVVDEDLMNEADEEHHVAKLLMAELEEIDQEDDHYDAKFTVLGEMVEHHIEEEEEEMFKKASKTDIAELTRRFDERKKELTEEMTDTLTPAHNTGDRIK